MEHGVESAADADDGPEETSDEAEPEIPLPEITTVADPSSLEHAELCEAVIDQERTIGLLLQRLHQKARKSVSLTPEQLEELRSDLPEDVAARVDESLNALSQQQRFGELELSLERARIARQAARLEDTRVRLEARARAMGLSLDDEGNLNAAEPTQPERQGSRSRRWLGVMGFGN
ncbi:MAG: hypothetical protein R3C49_00070 [Planctomycetaceae bacterium]